MVIQEKNFMEIINKIKDFLDSRLIISGMKMVMIAMLAVAGFSLLAFSYLPISLILFVDLLIFLTIIFFKWINLGLYAMVLFFPFWGWQFISGNINLPFVDLVAVALFAAMLIRTLMYGVARLEGYEWPGFVYLKKFFGWQYFLVFFLACSLALINNPDFLLGLKYLLRPILFFYLMFVVLPTNIILEKRIFRKVIGLFLVSGTFVAVMGLFTVLMTPGGWFDRRAQPFPVLGVNLLGGNWNALAEVLVVAIPSILMYFVWSNKIKSRGWLLILGSFVVSVLLLTFSRSGWLVLLFQSIILYFGFWGKKFFSQKSLVLIILTLFIVTSFYVLVWGQVSQVRGSDSSRWLMTSVSWYHFVESPIIGNGLNTFNRIVGGTFVYAVEYGDPLDSHGFVQKLLTETGALGFITFCLFLLYIYREILTSYLKSTKTNRLILLFIVMMAGGVVFFQLFSTSYFLSKMWLPIGVALAGAKLYGKEYERSV